MAKKPIAAAPAPTTPSPAAPTTPAKIVLPTAAPERKLVDPAPDPDKTYYYRLRKITGFLYEILEVEVDETKQIPNVVSKQDMKHLHVDRMTDLVCPHPDTIDKKRRDIKRKLDAEAAAKIVAETVAKVQG